MNKEEKRYFRAFAISFFLLQHFLDFERELVFIFLVILKHICVDMAIKRFFILCV